MGDRPLRLFTEQRGEVGACLTLDAAAARHAKVMRLRPQAEIELFDGRGWVASARLSQLDRTRVACQVSSAVVHPARAHRLTMWLGLAKGERPDLALRMLTELGVAEVRLVECERSVVRGQQLGEGRLSRLRLIAQEACAQSGNPFLPEIQGPSSLQEALSTLPPGAEQGRVALYERAQEDLSCVAELPLQVLALIGPEGGLSLDEIKKLQACAFVVVRMATPILRAETAAVVAAARLLDRMR